jgi:hypothetical protein
MTHVFAAAAVVYYWVMNSFAEDAREEGAPVVVVQLLERTTMK